MEAVSLQEAIVPPDVLARVPAPLAQHYRVLPLRMEGRTLVVAIADPSDTQALEELRLLLDCEIAPVPAPPQEIHAAIQRQYGIGASAVERLLAAGNPTASVPTAPPAEEITAQTGEASVVAFVNQLLLQAVQERATDIHLEPDAQRLRIRIRVDGILHDLPVPRDLGRLQQAVVSRVKVMARLDIAERRLPQDGRSQVRLGGQALDLRVSILPTTHGEGVDIRLLSPQMLYSLEQLGLAADHRRTLATLIARPHGIVLVAGPTGSGKTTTLYACLTQLNTPGRKIITIEDPVEYQVQGISQIQVHPKIGLSFAQGLRAVLRHDPDVLMVGEIRDAETAEITIRSALTGHLVFSTLHTNDAAGGVARLLDMGVEPYLLASSVLGFIAQRLVRVICARCRVACAPDAALRDAFGLDQLPATLPRGRGCPACKGTGYAGRTAIYEFLLVDEAIQQAILRRASSQEILRAAQQAGPPASPGQPGRAGLRTLRQDGWLKILQGVTTPEEVLRVS